MSSAKRLAREILDTRRLALGHATSPQLTSSAIDGGQLDITDGDGNRVGGLGLGDDGGFVIDYTGGPKPPKPSPPTVTADAGIFRIEWDGSFVNEGDEGILATSDTDRVEIHASMDENFVPDRVEAFGGAFATLDGGSFTLGPLPEAGTYYFRLVARSKSAQFSEPSERVEQTLAITSIDLEITDAWLTGEAAQNTADGKNSIWRGPDEPEVDPENPPKDGDIWFEMTEDGKSIPNIWDDALGQWVGNDDFRQSEIEKVQDELRQDIENIVVDANGTTTYWLPAAPDETTDPKPKVGDLWFDTSEEGGNKLHRFDGQEWVPAADQRIDTIRQAQEDFESDLDEVRTSANGKNSVHYSPRQPSPTDDGIEGDVWWVGEVAGERPQIFLMGDSITEGSGSSNTAYRWQTLLQKRFNPNGPEYPFIPAWPATPSPGLPVASGGAVSHSSSWSSRTGLGWRTLEILREAEGQEPGWVEFTFTGTSAEVMFTVTSGSGNALISVDGATPVEVSTKSYDIGREDYGWTWSTGPLADGEHTVRVSRIERANPGSSDSVWVQGLLTYRNDENAGIRLLDGGHHGMRASQLQSDPQRLSRLFGDGTNNGAIAGAGGMSFMVYLLGTNDYGGGVPVADYKQYTENAIASARANGYRGRFLLVGMYLGQDRNAGLWGTYVDQLADIAAGDPMIDFLDLRDEMPGPEGDPSLFADKLHPNDAGHKVMADVLEPYIEPALGSSWNVVAQYVHDGTKWVATELEDSVIASLDAAKIVSGYIDAARIKAGSLSADKVLVGEGSNLIPSKDFSAWVGNSHNTGGLPDPSLTEANATGGPGSLPSMTIVAPTGFAGGYLGLEPGAFRVPVQPGGKYRVQAKFKAAVDVPGGAISIYVRGFPKGSSAGGWVDGGRGTNQATPAGQWGIAEGVIEVPEGYSECAIGIFKSGDFTATIAEPVFASLVAGTLIEDGAVTTEKIQVGAITAESGIIGSIDAGKITVGELDGARIKAGSVLASSVAVGDFSNLATIDAVRGVNVTRPANYATEVEGDYIRTKSTSQNYVMLKDRTNTVPFKPGDSLRFTFKAKNYLGTAFNIRPTLWVYPLLEDQAATGGKAFTGPDVTIQPGEGQEYSGTITIPESLNDGVTYRSWIIGFASAGGSSPKNLGVRDVTMYRMTGHTLIQNGAITTDKIAVGAITAESGIIGSLDANVITVGKIMGNQLDADAINGKTITGATIRTASSGSRVELTHNGLKQYNSLGATIVDMTAGSFTLQGGSITGSTIKTANSGSRVEINTQGLKQYNSSNEVIAEMVAGSMVMRGVLEQENSIGRLQVGPTFGSGNVSPGISWSNIPGDAYGAGIGVATGTNTVALVMQGPGGSSSASRINLFKERAYIASYASGNSYLNMADKSFTLRAQDSAGDAVGFISANDDKMMVSAYTRNLELWGRRVQSMSVWNTNTSDRPVYINGSTGSLGQGPSSSLRYKQDVEAGRVLDSILDVDLASWRYTGEVDAYAKAARYRAEIGEGPLPVEISEVPSEPGRHYGAIAEQVDELGLSELVFYDAFGRPDALRYELFGVALIPIVRSLRDRIESLEAQLASA